MKNLLKLLIFFTLLLFWGCLSSEDSVVGVEDPSTGDTAFVRILEYDLSTGVGSVEDTATGEIYSGEVLFYDKENITVVEGVDTLSFKIVPSTQEKDTTDMITTLPIEEGKDTVKVAEPIRDTLSDTTYAPLDTPYVDTLATADPWPFPWEDGQYVYWDSVGTRFHQAFKDAGYDNYIENSYSSLPSWVVPTHIAAVPERSIRTYSHSKGKAYVIEDRLMFLIPDRNMIDLIPLEPTGNPDVDSTILLRNLLRDNRLEISQRMSIPMDSMDILFYTYGRMRDPEKVLLSNWENPYGAQTGLKPEECVLNHDTDMDYLPTRYDPGCSALFEGGTQMTLDWFLYLKQNPDVAHVVPLVLEAFSIDPSKDIPLHFVNNPFQWATLYIHRGLLR